MTFTVPAFVLVVVIVAASVLAWRALDVYRFIKRGY